MSAFRSHSPVVAAGAILRGAGVVVSAPLLQRSRRNASGALHEMRHAHHSRDVDGDGSAAAQDRGHERDAGSGGGRS